MCPRAGLGATLLLAVAQPLAAPVGAQSSARATRVEVVAPAAPVPVPIAGHRVLVYELHITNFDRTPLALRRIEVYATSDAATPLATYQDSALDALVEVVGSGSGMPMGGPVGSQPPRRLDIGRREIAYMWVELPSDAAMPAGLRHRLTFAILDTAMASAGETGESALDSVLVPVSRDPVPVLAPPLAGGRWLVGEGPSNTLANIVGNYVILHLGPQRYALFAHLQRGSVRVHLHERVRRGDILGLVGNSGQATGPHLHFQVMDGNSPLASEGRPFLFPAYTDLGPGSTFEEDHHPATPRRHQLPPDGEVIELPKEPTDR